MEYVRFGDLYSIPSSNGVSRPSAVRGEGYKMINMGELFSNDIIRDIPMERVKLSEKEKAKFLVKEGDLLFARQSLVASGAGKCSIVKELNEETTFESHLIRVRLDNNIVNPWYYYYLFQLPYNPVKTIVNQCAQAGIRGTELVKIKVPLPPIKVQNKVAETLSTYDDLIENNNKRIKLLEQMAENLYKEWFVRFRFPDHENTEFENGFPKDWEYVKLGGKLRFERGVGYSSADLMDSDNVLLSMNNIRPWGGFIRDYSRKYSGRFKEFQVVKSNDLIMSITDMTQDRRIIGYVGLVPSSNQTRIICTHLMKVVALQKEYQNTFLYGLFNFSGLSRCISERATGANVLGLTANILNNVKWYFPNVDLISKYCSIVNPLYEAIEQYENQNENLIKQRDLLLPRLMSGKLEV